MGKDASSMFRPILRATIKSRKNQFNNVERAFTATLQIIKIRLN